MFLDFYRQVQAVGCAPLTNSFLHCQANNWQTDMRNGDTRHGANYLERLRNIFEFVENELDPETIRLEIILGIIHTEIIHPDLRLMPEQSRVKGD
ncbi:hypothetical protein CEXT_57441 [Caerostris extrusa]|uniref:Uncharacterized protein n=1 Tax=Caerostris extrusa TaxID=172846 RepID=A0AAV4UG40_CAEEX|nr:hypothetical protein CEXT_57441 [Caerostris extrusa]